MPLPLARLLLAALGAYAAAGLVFAAFFLVRGVERIDPSARGSSWRFRLLILPGVVACWPYLGRRWARGAQAPPDEVNAHRLAAARRRR